MSDNNDRCILCNTVEGIGEIWRKNGTGYWHVSQHRWKGFEFMVLTQNFWKAQEMKGNMPGAWSFATGQAPHGSAFAVGRLAGLEEWTDNDPGESWRGTFIFSEIARLDPPIPNVWPGVRSSILYDKTLSGLGIDPSSLKWEPMPPREVEAAEVKAPPRSSSADALDDITRYAAKRLGFDPDLLDVSITIRRAAEAEAAAMLLT